MIRIALVAGFVAVTAIALRSEAQPKPVVKPTPAPSIALKVLADVEANYQKPQQLSATFEQTVTNAISGKPAPSGGTLIVEKPDKLRFEYLQPKKANPKPKMTYLYDGKVMWVLDHQNLQFGKQTAAASELSSLMTFFLGAGTLMRDYNIALTSDAALVPTGATALELTPKKPSTTARIVLVVDAKRNVTQASIVDSSGNVQTMKFGNVVLNKPAPVGTFVLDPKSIAGWRELKK